MRPVAEADFRTSLIIGDEIGQIGRQVSAPVDPAGPETARPGRVEQQIVIGLVGQVEAMDEAVALGALVDVVARAAEAGGAEIGAIVDRVARIIRVEAEESDQRIVEPVEPPAAGHGQLRGDVERQLAERRIIAIDALLVGQPDVALGRRDGENIGKIVDNVILDDAVGLALVEQAGDEPQPFVGGRREPELVRLLGKGVVRLDVLVGINQVAIIVVEVRAVAVERVVEIGVIGIVELAVDLPLHVRSGIGHVEIGDLALDGQRRLPPFVVVFFGIELHRLELAEPRFLGERAAGDLALGHDLRRDRPIIVEVDAQRGARAIGLDVVVILFRQVEIVERDARRGEGQRARHVVDIARVLAVPADHARRDVGGDGQVDEPFAGVAEIAVGDLVQLQIYRPVGAGEIGLVGDDSHGAGLARRAV